MTNKFSLKLNTVYKRRDGKLTGPLVANSSLGAYAYPFLDPKHNEAYSRSGSSSKSVGKKKSKRDLVGAEWTSVKGTFTACYENPQTVPKSSKHFVDRGSDGFNESPDRIVSYPFEMRCDVANLLPDVLKELEGARGGFPPFNSLHEAYSVLYEEMDELWQEIKTKQRVGGLANLGRTQLARKEAIQVAAMAIRLILDCCEPAGPSYGK